ncbi:hypothetical protein HpBGD53_06380 [Helicobacter pylori]
MYKVADIFCGAGGLSYGFFVHPYFEVIWANDIDKDAILSYQANHKEAQTIFMRYYATSLPQLAMRFN